MKLYWSDAGPMRRCYSERMVRIRTRDWGGGYREYDTQDMGYVIERDGRLMACVYGTINPDCPGAWFDDIDEAKAYVEQQALVGIALNKLTR